MQTLIHDLRYGARMLLKQPSSTIVAMLTLALGVGANTALFSFLNVLLLKPVAGVSQPERLVQIGRMHSGEGFDTMAWLDYQDIAAQSKTLAGIAIERGGEYHFSSGTGAERLRGLMVTGNYFNLLGTQAMLGRMLDASDAASEGGVAVVVISHNLWRARFGADPQVIGRSVVLNGYRYEIIGVADEAFTGTTAAAQADVWLPITMWRQADPQLANWKVDWFGKRDATWLHAVARLKPGVTVVQAQSELALIADRLRAQYPKPYEKTSFKVAAGLGLNPQMREQVRSMFSLPLGIVGVVLLIACANVAGVLLVRMHARRKEIAVRLALGASRWQITRQLLLECMMLALAGGLFGLWLAVWLRDGLRTLLPADMFGETPANAFALDWRVFAFAFGVAALTGLLCGLLPSWQMARQDLVPVLKDQRGSGQRAGRLNLRGALVVVQVALSLLLLIGAGLCVKALRNARTIKTGFDTERVLTASLNLDKQNYTEEQGRNFQQQLLERLKALPGVERASLGVTIPLGGSNWSSRITAEDAQGKFPDSRHQNTTFNVVSSDFLPTLGIPLQAGRNFTEADEAARRPVVILGASLAQKLWPNESPLGKHLKFDWGGKDFLIEIIGVARDAKGAQLFGDQRPHLYFSRGMLYQGDDVVFIRTTGRPESLSTILPSAVQALDHNLPVTEIKPLAAYFDDQLTPQRLAAWLITSFGALALLLALLGLYGVLAFSVAQRTPEIGIRLALGAPQSAVLRLILQQGMRLVIVGLLLGLAGAWATTRFLQSVLVEVSPLDAAAFISMPLLLLAAALLACWMPARRASKVDPLIALRSE